MTPAPPPPRLAEWARSMADLWWTPIVVPLLLTAATCEWSDPPSVIARTFVFSLVPALCLLAALTGLYAAFWDRAPTRIRQGPLRFVAHPLLIGGGVLVALEAAARLVVLLPLGVSLALARDRFWQFGPTLAVGMTTVALVLETLRQRAESASQRAERAGHEALQARFEALQARTDPHFLFNSLNTIAALIAEDPARAEDAVERLADLFRYALEAGQRSRVPLRRELDAVADYLTLQGLRFEERLVVETVVELAPGEAERLMVPPLTLQPVVENAVVHGRGARPLTVRVAVRCNGPTLRLVVSDDGCGFGHSRAAGAGTGLTTLRERLRLLYGPAAHLRIESTPGAGSRVEIGLPLSADPEEAPR